MKIQFIIIAMLHECKKENNSLCVNSFPGQKFLYKLDLGSNPIILYIVLQAVKSLAFSLCV